MPIRASIIRQAAIEDAFHRTAAAQRGVAGARPVLAAEGPTVEIMELEFIEWLRGRLPADGRAPLGLSDDAAILQLAGGGRCIVTTDMLTDGVDFHLGEASARRVGRKALAVNLSDLAAMAARPLAAFVSLALPGRSAKQLAIDLYEGMIPLAEEFGVVLAGGDTNCWDGPLAISIAVVGEVGDRGPLLRSGARPGDHVLVTGAFGGSILGRHFDFPPRVREALLLHARYDLHAAIDVSDGLSLDLARLAEASGCGASLTLDSIPIDDCSQRLARSRGDGQTALDHALSDGEDFELILAASPGEADRILRDQPLDTPVTRIGDFISPHGLWRTTSGGRQPLAPRGFLHEPAP